MTTNFPRRLQSSWPPATWTGVRVLVAVSGGADSVALLRGLATNSGSGGDLIAAHYNHQLRGSDAAADEAFLRELCNELGIECVVGHADDEVQVIHTAREDGTVKRDYEPRGSEATWRTMRYGFLSDVARQVGARFVATAHTADDQAETILHRLIRGSGLAGLAGIPRVRELVPGVTLIRPLLDITRREVLAYLAAIGQPFREDATNRDRRFTRNRLRTELLPLLARDYNEGIVSALLRLGTQAAEANEVIATLASELFERCRVVEGAHCVELDCQPLAVAVPLVGREMFVSIWTRRDWPRGEMGYTKWCELHEFAVAGRDGTELTLPGGILVTRDAARLELRRR